jgi:hypothetical protein
MLRHIISVSLAITACATFISTKANAATLTAIPVNGLQRNPGDEMKFLLVLNPTSPPNNGIQYWGIVSGTSSTRGWNQDQSELSRRGPGLQNLVNPGASVISTTTVATLTFDVTNPVKDGNSDLFNVQALYKEILGLGETGVIEYGEYQLATVSETFDVEPVPEPLTILGAATALGYGAILKRQSFKNKKS